MNLIDLSNKTILITGASAGIGQGTAKLISELGARIFITGRDIERLKKTFDSLSGTGHQILPADLSEEKGIEILTKELPELDGIVHSAGVIKPFPVKFIGKKHIDEVFDINLFAPVLLTSAVLKSKKLKAGASMIFLSSISSQHPYQGGALYTSSKAAIEAYCRAVAQEYAHKKIRANCISPGLVKTAMFKETMNAMTEEKRATYAEKYPLGYGEVKDVASAIAFFLSDASRWITGANLQMDGGLSINHL
ncbi:MAG: 3-oxoacyl-ACP reductase [Flavobacteriales bacterium]|nr:MAG: 3-oxoacyl-ACP reductase [Flavobacteriales bacterium]